MASYRQYRSTSNYRARQDSRNSDASLDYTDPFVIYNLKDTPVIGSGLKASDQLKFYNDYLRNRGMTWKDVKYPALLGGVSPVGAGISMAESVSRAWSRLYR